MIELSELQDAAQKAFPADKVAPSRDESWQLIAEMGWLMLPVPEELGGLGLGREAQAALHFELGRVLSRAPLTTAMFTVQALCMADGLANRQEWIERACAGEFITVNMLANTVVRSADDKLNGTLFAVPDADMASHVIVFAPEFSVLVPLDAPGVTLRECPLWDESRRMFEIDLAGHAYDPALVLAEGPRSNEIGMGLKCEVLLALAADALGGATATLDFTVEYLKMRKQFERPLAMFQALKHRCADLKTQIVAAEALMWSRAADPKATLADMGALKALACDVYRFVAEEAIQLHGGIGLTEEHQCHLFMKRAMLNLSLGGSQDDLLERAGRQAMTQFA